MPSGFSELKSRIIDTGLCTRCGGCAASCPVDAISFTSRGMELTGECIECGICLEICPGKGMDLSFHERRLFGRSRKKPQGGPIGIHRSRMDLTASEREVFIKGYYGGRVSALLIHLLEKDEIDAALLTDWSGTEELSVGRGVVARSREDVLRSASSKYVFSPVLSLLKEIYGDESIRSAALVGLPCHIHAFRNMELHPGTEHLVKKVAYVISLNCGGANLDEEHWKALVEKLTGVNGEDIASFRSRKVSGTGLRFTVTRKGGGVVEKEMPLRTYLAEIDRSGIWERCRMCPDYSGELSDITFGMPVMRTPRGEEAVLSAVKEGALMRSSFKRRASQRVIDMVMSRRKKWRAKRTMARREKEGKRVPRFS